MDTCLLCGGKERLHTHHIQEQAKADKNGFIEHFHKDEKFNLAVLCESCHRNLHDKKQKLDVKQLLGGIKVTMITE